MSRYFTLLLVLSAIALCCKPNSKSDGSNNSKATNRALEFEPLSAAILTEMNKSITSIDIISLRKEVNASMSFSDAQAIQYVISFISEEKGILTACKPEGHLVFQINGEITQEADIYYNDGCNAIVWNKGNKITNINKISNEGVDFFKNFLKPHPNAVSDSTIRANTVSPQK